MTTVNKVTFPSRDNDLNFYCPLCGNHSMDDEGEVSPCKHLVAVHLNIADPAVMYARPDIANKIEDDFGWDEIEDVLGSHQQIEQILVIEECTSGPAMAEFQIAYEYCDED